MATRGAQLLVYGAYGYSGQLVVEAALRRGLRPVVAGRSADRAAALGRQTGLEHRAFSLDDAAAAHAALDGVAVVLNCAGPFSQTAAPLATACLAAGAHYLDITGEYPVIEALAARTTAFARAGLLLMPSVGADVVPSDCLALHMKERLPQARRLELCIRLLELPSRGTANSFVEALGKPNVVRAGGELVERRMGADSRSIELDGERLHMIGIPWGDIATAWRTTGIPDIAVFMRLALPGAQPFMALAGRSRAIWQWPPVQRLLKRLVQKLPEGPDATARASGHADFVATASDAAGNIARSHLRTPEGYALTAETASEIARRVLAGELPADHTGFRTPAALFGADFILGFEGVSRREL